MIRKLLLACLGLIGLVEAFVVPLHDFRMAGSFTSTSALFAAGKKKKRRRKTPVEDPVSKDVVKEEAEDKTMIAEIASFQFEPDAAIAKGKCVRHVAL